MAGQEKLFFAELRRCGKSDRWRGDMRYTAELAKAEGDSRDSGLGASAQDGGGDDHRKRAPVLVSVTRSILLPAGDCSIVDLQIVAIERAVTLLHATAAAARVALSQMHQVGSGIGDA